MFDETAIYEPAEPSGALRQGELLTNVVQAVLDPTSVLTELNPVVDFRTHEIAIVVSQDCELDWDYRARNGDAPDHKLIPSVLFCEATTAEKLKAGVEINSKIWQRIRQNKDERYQFLEKIPPEQDIHQQGLPELGIDFKRFFTIPTEEVYLCAKNEMKRRCRLRPPYLQHFCSRFYNFQSRVALPSDHYSEPLHPHKGA